jgi:nucleoside-diphosphate-sugar epimerase
MKVLVTGASGFIGKYVIRELIKTKHDIIATSIEPFLRIPDIAYERLSYIQCDLNDDEEDYFSFFGSPDCLIHLSWEGLPHYKDLFHFERNLMSNYRFLKNMVEHG